MVNSTLYNAEFGRRNTPYLLQIMRCVGAVSDDVVGATYTARYHYIEVMMQARHGCVGEKVEGNIMHRQHAPFGPVGCEDKIGGVEEIKRAAREPINRGEWQIEPMP